MFGSSWYSWFGSNSNNSSNNKNGNYSSGSESDSSSDNDTGSDSERLPINQVATDSLRDLTASRDYTRTSSDTGLWNMLPSAKSITTSLWNMLPSPKSALNAGSYAACALNGLFQARLYTASLNSSAESLLGLIINVGQLFEENFNISEQIQTYILESVRVGGAVFGTAFMFVTFVSYLEDSNKLINGEQSAFVGYLKSNAFYNFISYVTGLFKPIVQTSSLFFLTNEIINKFIGLFANPDIALLSGLSAASVATLSVIMGVIFSTLGFVHRPESNAEQTEPEKVCGIATTTGMINYWVTAYAGTSTALYLNNLFEGLKKVALSGVYGEAAAASIFVATLPFLVCYTLVNFMVYRMNLMERMNVQEDGDDEFAEKLRTGTAWTAVEVEAIIFKALGQATQTLGDNWWANHNEDSFAGELLPYIMCAISGVSSAASFAPFAEKPRVLELEPLPAYRR